jgi:AAA domain
MTLQLLDAAARLNEARGPKILITGPTAIGKTSLLKTLPLELLPAVLLVDLEAGDLPIADLPIASTRPQTWLDLRDLAVAIGGPNLAHATGAYSQSHYDGVIADPAFAGLTKFDIIFIDSYTELSRRCRIWCEQQPESFNAYGKRDTRSMYGLVGRELIAWTQQIQHARARTVILVTILEKIVDDRGVPTWQVQLEGQRTRNQLPAILDVIVAMVWVPFKDKPRRAFVCQSDTYPVKDRSGRLAPIEEPHLGKLLDKLATRQP